MIIGSITQQLRFFLYFLPVVCGNFSFGRPGVLCAASPTQKERVGAFRFNHWRDYFTNKP